MLEHLDAGIQLAAAVGDVVPAIRHHGRQCQLELAELPGRILTSALKRMDVAVFKALESVAQGRFQGGHRWLGAADGAVDITEMVHTRSLFSAADLAAAAGRFAVAVRREIPPDRISLAPASLARSKRIVLLAVGPEKREIIRRFLDAPGSTTAGRALMNCDNGEMWYTA